MRTIANIKKRLANTTKGRWVYQKRRHTHDYCIYSVEGAHWKDKSIEHEQGVIGSSEWIWIEDNDANFIVNAKEDIEHLLKVIEELEEKML